MTKWIGPDRFFWFTDRISVLPDNPAAPTHAVLAQLLYPMHRRAGAHSRARGRSRTAFSGSSSLPHMSPLPQLQGEHAPQPAPSSDGRCFWCAFGKVTRSEYSFQRAVCQHRRVPAAPSAHPSAEGTEGSPRAAPTPQGLPRSRLQQPLHRPPPCALRAASPTAMRGRLGPSPSCRAPSGSEPRRDGC